MKEYFFYDNYYDKLLGKDFEFDIAGQDYKILLGVCFQYCTTVAFRIAPRKVNLVDQLEPYRIHLTDSTINAFDQYHSGLMYCPEKNAYCPFEIRHYRLAPEVQDILLHSVDDLFHWMFGGRYENPEDPAFFRADGSVFFSSCIHDGECRLSSKENEDVSRIVSCQGWYLKREYGT